VRLPITATPQGGGFRPKRFVITSNFAPNFNVVSITVGRSSQFAATGELDGLAFTEASLSPNLRGDTVQPGLPLVVTVRNKGAPSPFRAIAFGDFLE